MVGSGRRLGQARVEAGVREDVQALRERHLRSGAAQAVQPGGLPHVRPRLQREGDCGRYSVVAVCAVQARATGRGNPGDIRRGED